MPPGPGAQGAGDSAGTGAHRRELTEPSQVLVSRAAAVSRWATRLAAGGAALIAGLVLLGWVTGTPALTRLFLSTVGMAANAAIAIVLASVALLALPAREGRRRTVALLAAGGVVAIATATLLQYLLGVDLGIDQLLFRDPAAARGSLRPGRMSPVAAVNLLLFGLGWFALRSRALGHRFIARVPAKLILVSTLLALAGYLFDAQPLYALASTTRIASHTTVALLLLGVGLTASQPHRGLFSLLVTDDAGGALVRRLLPAAIAVPLVFAGLRLWGQRAGYYGFEVGLAILACSNVIVFVWLVAWSGASVGRYDRRRYRAEAALRAANEALEARVDARTRELAQLNESLRLEVAERTRVAEALRQGEERRERSDQQFQQLVEALPLAVTVARDGQFVYLNHAANELFGYPDGELAGEPVERVLHPEERDARQSLTEIRLEARVVRCARPDGAELLLDCISLPFEFEQGAGILTIGRDVTAVRRLEESARQATALWRAILDGAEYSIIAVTPEGHVREFNPGAERMLGYTAAEVVGKALHPDVHDPEEVAARARVLSRELGRTIEPGFETFVAKARRGDADQNEWTYIRKDGRRTPVRLSVTALRGAEGEILGFLGIASDITAIKRTERELIEAKESAERAMRARSDFLARMSHEIRTPMNGILGMIDLALQTEVTDEQRDYLATTQTSAQMLLAIINDILDFSKIDSGKLRLESIPFRLPETIAEPLRPLSTLARRKGIELLFEMAPDTPRGLVGDPYRLVQVVNNLVGNAIKFTERGEVVVSLGARALNDDVSELRVEVRDTGPGIPPAKLQVIFEAFSQVDEATTRTHGGTGLGLAISSELVELMGGKIEVSSEVGRGSRFCVRVPLPLDKQARPAAEPSTALGDTLALVAIDHPGQRAIVEGMLRSWQMAPVVADAREARPLARAAQGEGKPFRVVILSGTGTGELPRREAMAPDARLVFVIDEDHAVAPPPGWASDEVATVRTPVLASALMEAIQGRPREVVTEAPAAAPGAAPRSATGADGLRILVAEDNPINRKVIGGMLEKMGHTVEMANDGREAVTALAGRSFDIVLMDIEMPLVDGLEATRLVRAFGNTTPIVAVTAQAMKGDDERCLAAGMSAYLSKPINRAELQRVLARFAPAAAPPPPPPPPAPAPEPEENAGSFDKEQLLERIAGDRELLAELVELFSENAPALIEAVKTAAAAGDAPGLERAAHSLVGLLLNLSAAPAAERARSVEMLARGRDLARAAAGIGGLEAAVRSLEGSLRAEIRS